MFYMLQAAANGNNGIAAPIITGVAGLIGIYLAWHLKNKPGRSPNHIRFKSLNGTFYGAVTQGECDDQCEITIKTKSKNRVTGSMKVFYKGHRNNKATSQEMEIFGDYRYDSFLTLQYINKDKSTKQAGVMLLEYVPEGKVLKGEFLGYGPVSKNFDECKGQISVTKKI